MSDQEVRLALQSDRLVRISDAIVQSTRTLTPDAKRPVQVWLGGGLMVQVFADRPCTRLSVSRTTTNGQGRWRDGITWDELQDAKSQIGMGDRWAIEIYPAEDDLCNVANMRHLWILDEAPACAWRKAVQP